MGIPRSSFVVAVAASALVCGCFALFSLDDYGPPAGDGGANDATSGDSGGSDASADAPLGKRLVFVTSERFTGSIGGTNGADSRCNALAADAGIDASFVAWLGEGSTGPVTRLAQPSREIVMANGELVAANLGELTDGGPRVPIAVTETKQGLGNPPCAQDRVWTNSLGNGRVPDGGVDCSSWSSVLGQGGSGRLGGTGADDWTTGCNQQNCDGQARLYCFQK